MTKQLTERQKGIQDFRDLFRKHNGLVAGDRGIRRAYNNFLKRNGLKPEEPTDDQNNYVEILNTSAPLMETTIEAIERRRGD
jgi:hypothetical protein